MNRRRYYDIFSLFYDSIIALHSRDQSGGLRRFLLSRALPGGSGLLLDVCTGTGAVPLSAAKVWEGSVRAIGLDFSGGMLKKAALKARDMPQSYVDFVQADATRIPFSDSTFDAVTCSHAMYELSPEARNVLLSEARRVLVPGGRFAMMEHCEPERPFVRMLYRIRLAGLLGQKENLYFARNEVPFLSRFFSDVRLDKAPGGRSKVIWGTRP